MPQNYLKNPHFLEEAGEYLEANGFTPSNYSHATASHYYFKDKKAVCINGNTMHFCTLREPDDTFEMYASHTGISRLGIFEFMLLFHLAEMIPLKDFIKKASQAEEPKSIPMFSSIMQFFGQNSHLAITL